MAQRKTVEVSAVEPDWSREHPVRLWDPSRRLLQAIRGYQANAGRSPTAVISRKWWAFMHRFWSLVSQAEIDVNCRIGGGLLIPHPNGIVIHPDTIIGPNCLIFQQVTIGTRESSEAPIIGGHVDIGAGAKILGGIKLGNHCCVGANAVVLRDVPERETAVGVPALNTKLNV